MVPSSKPLLEREEDAYRDKDCNGFIGVSRGLTRVVRRSNKKGLEGEHGWDKALMQTSEGLSAIGGVA